MRRFKADVLRKKDERIGIVRRIAICYSFIMTTVAEIEHAIERLPASEVSEIAEWVAEYQLMLSASGDIFSMLDAEEGEGEQWSDPNRPVGKSGS